MALKTKQNKKSRDKSEYRFIGKTVFFPKQGILAVGDLHLGYEEMLKNQGVMVPFNQVQIVKEELVKVFKNIKEKGEELKKIVLLGDIKHHFSFQKGEKFEVRKIMSFLEKYVDRENIILIKGNHEKFELDKRKHHDYYLEDLNGGERSKKGDKIAFTHGDRSFPELFDKEVKYLVMGHLHPAVLLEDEQGIKREKYKCHLFGKFKGKKTFILPSFFPFIEGSEIEEMGKEGKEPAFIPLRKLRDFEVYISGGNSLEVYDFGKFRDFKR